VNLSDYINIRTFIILALSQLSCFIAIKYNFTLNFDFVLFGLAIAFPLGFSIQSAFKRREKALEYLSLFKSGLLALHYSFRTTKKLSSEKKSEIRNILVNASDELLHQLRSSDGDMNNFQSELDKIYDFIEQNREAN